LVVVIDASGAARPGIWLTIELVAPEVNPNGVGGKAAEELPIVTTELVAVPGVVLVADVVVAPGSGGVTTSELVMPELPAPLRLLVTTMVELVPTGGGVATIGEVTGRLVVTLELVPEPMPPGLDPEPRLFVVPTPFVVEIGAVVN
jgi:hypothetical protein